jgi:hypothetical protein
MAAVLNERTEEEVGSVILFFWANCIQPVEIHHELVTIYGPGAMVVHHMRKWCREFGNCRARVADEQRSGRPSISADNDKTGKGDGDRILGHERCPFGWISVEAVQGSLPVITSAQ